MDVDDLKKGLPSSSAWNVVVEKYSSDPSLSDEERRLLKTTPLNDYVEDLKNLKISEVDRSKVQACLRKLSPFLKNLERFGRALDVLAGADAHGVLSLLWGSVRLVIVVVRDVESLHELCINFFNNIGQDIGRLTAYEQIFSQSVRLHHALCAAFDELLEFCAWSRRTMQESKARRLAMKFLSDTYKQKATEMIDSIRAKCVAVEKEAELASLQSNVAFQKEAEHFFKQSRDFYQESERFNAVSQNDTALRALQDVLAPLAIDDDIDLIQRRRVDGTCAWLSECEEFKPLLSSDTMKKPKTLWICGPPGSGKTYLAAYVVEKLEEIGPTGIFLCDAKDATKRSATNILRTWCWQLVQRMKSLIAEVARQVAALSRLTQKALRSILGQLAFRREQPTFLVLDGLDECEDADRVEILDTLEQITGLTNLIILSRPEGDIEKAFRKWKQKGSTSKLTITPRQSRPDIDLVIQEGVRRFDDLDPSLRKSIREKLQLGANGMFVYVRLMIQELEQQDTNKERRKVLEQLPQGIDALYDRAMQKIKALKGPRKDRLLCLLKLVLCSFQPLTLDELSTALAITIGEDSLDHENRPDVQKLISDYCQSFVEINPSDKRVTLLHDSVKRYLVRSQSSTTNLMPIELHEAHEYMAATCLTFLNYEERGFVKRPDENNLVFPLDDPFPFSRTLHGPFRSHITNHNFLGYAVCNWALHVNETFAKRSDTFEWLQQPLQSFVSSEAHIVKWMELFHFFVKESENSALLTRDVIETWILKYESQIAITKGEDSAQLSETRSMAFSWNGARIDYDSGAKSRYKGLVSYPTAEFRSSLNGYWEKLMTKLGFGGDHDHIFRWQRWTLTEVMTRYPEQIAGFFDLTEFLTERLDKGVDVDLVGIMDRTTLGHSAWGESLDVIKLLMNRGADIQRCPRFSDCDGAFALVEAVSHDEFPPMRGRDFKAANLLLDMGARVESDVRDLNPLHVMFQWWAETPAEFALLQRILERSADCSKLLEMPNPFNGLNCLHATAMFNLRDTLKMLISNHREPKVFLETTWGTEGKTALHESCHHTTSVAGQVLLDYGADIHRATSITKETPLAIAAASRSDMLAKLVAAGADCAITDSLGQTALHKAACANWPEGIQILHAGGASLDVKDTKSYTALDVALNMENEAAISSLKRLGAHESPEWLDERRLQANQTQTLYETYFVLKCAFSNRSRRAPPSLIGRILDDAEFWVEVSITNHRQIVVMQADAGKPYLISRPIQGAGNHAVRKVAFNVTCEQHEGPHPPDQGEKKSWTWIELDTFRNSLAISRPKLFQNQLGVTGKQRHSIVRYASKISDDPVSALLANLENGESLTLIPMARLPDWRITIYEAEIRIFLTQFLI